MPGRRRPFHSIKVSSDLRCLFESFGHTALALVTVKFSGANGGRAGGSITGLDRNFPNRSPPSWPREARPYRLLGDPDSGAMSACASWHDSTGMWPPPSPWYCNTAN
jgi:hypothetical protein